MGKPRPHQKGTHICQNCRYRTKSGWKAFLHRFQNGHKMTFKNFRGRSRKYKRRCIGESKR